MEHPPVVRTFLLFFYVCVRLFSHSSSHHKQCWIIAPISLWLPHSFLGFLCFSVYSSMFFAVHLCVCASSELSAVQCSILGLSAGWGGRSEQWCYPFHPQPQHGSVVEEIPATNTWRTRGPKLQSACSRCVPMVSYSWKPSALCL